jgi:nucleoside-diphosphate-sugar epimerase
MKRRILITGGLGFVGRALVDRFADLGHEVTCVDLVDKPFRKDVKFQKLDIRDPAAVSEACAGMDSIVHNASLVHTRHNREEDVWGVNLGGTEHILQACTEHGIPRLTYISSASAVYEGADIENGDESLPYSTISQAPYADSKIAAEKKVLAFSGTGKTQVCAIRPHVVFGAGDGRFVPTILRKAKEGKLSRAVGNRDKLSDFTYISNLVDAVAAAEERLVPGSPVCGQAYFITNGEPIAFFDFVEKLIVEMGYPPIHGKVPYWVAYSVAAAAEAWDTLRGGTLNAEDGLSRFSVRYMVTHHYFNIAKARRDLGWQPAVSLQEGIRLTARQLSPELRAQAA